MTRTRMIGLAAAGLWLGLAAVPASADGLAQFEKSMKPQIPPDTMTYKSAKGLGNNGFVLEGVVIKMPPSDDKSKSEPIAIKTITVEDIDFDAIEKNQPPMFAKVRFEGISGTSAAGFDLKKMTGLDTLSADFQLDYKLEPERKTFTLNRLELNLNGLGRLETSVVLDGVGAEAVGDPSAALNDASLRSASVVYDDRSLLGKALPIVAVFQGSDPKELIAMATTVLDGAREGQGEKAQKAIDALVAFVEDYEKPKGPLRIALAPPDKVSSAQLSAANSADDVVKLLGIQVTYAGSRSSKPGEAAAAAGATGKGAKDVPGKDDDDDDKKTLNKKK